MCKSEKIAFIDLVVSLLRKYLPDASEEVRYFIACQFALESKFGMSHRATVDNNFDGMKIPSFRPSLNTAMSGVFCAFNSIEECVVDYCYWVCYSHINRLELFNLSLYTRRLIALKYCPDSDYIDKIYSLFNSLKS